MSRPGLASPGFSKACSLFSPVVAAPSRAEAAIYAGVAAASTAHGKESRRPAECRSRPRAGARFADCPPTSRSSRRSTCSSAELREREREGGAPRLGRLHLPRSAPACRRIWAPRPLGPGRADAPHARRICIVPRPRPSAGETSDGPFLAQRGRAGPQGGERGGDAVAEGEIRPAGPC